MRAMEKVAWTEFLVSVTTLVVVTALYPWLGNGATSEFGLLAFVFASAWFLRRRGTAVVVDERDRAIERQARNAGASAAWQFLFVALIAVGLGQSYLGMHDVPLRVLNWLIWVQFAIFIGVKGLVGVVCYRRQNRAA